jgi:ADP-ribose pyrophosphatase YjhB (NUDIX family)
MSREIEIIARGVCVKDGRILLCHGKGATNTYLPGGHIDFKESASRALVREIKEELGVKSVLGRFLGVVEHSYSRKAKVLCEINLVFAVNIPGLKPGKDPKSAEDYIEFFWWDMKKLATSKLEPRLLRTCLPEWLSGRAVECWASTIDKPGRCSSTPE